MPIPYLPRGRHPGKHPSVKREKTRREESGVVESKEETGGGRRREMERRSRKEVRERGKKTRKTRRERDGEPEREILHMSCSDRKHFMNPLPRR